MTVERKGARAISDETQAFGPHTEAIPARTAAAQATRGSGWVLGDRYRILDRIGTGGMAEVFRANDELLNREVAVKVFRSEHVAHDSAHGLERQQLEVQALARLNHPNLITLYDGSIDGGGGPTYLVMELIDGPSLAASVAESPLAEPSAREIGIQIAEALAYVHAQGMVHRDVKPENILLGVDRTGEDSTMRARLSDFGIVRLLGSERLTRVDFTLGTASYLAPEQARGSAVDPPADVYSLGLVLIEALTGVRSFDGPPLEAALARLTHRPAIPQGLPEPWPGLLYAMTEADPAARPTAAQVARALREVGRRSLPIAAEAIPLAAAAAPVPAALVDSRTTNMPLVGRAPTTGPSTAWDTAATTAVPSAAAAGALAPPSGAQPVAGRRHRPNGILIAAAVSLLLIAGALAVFLLGGSGNSPTTNVPASSESSTTSAPPSTHHSSTHTRGGVPPAPVTHASSTRARTSAAHSSQASSSAPATSAPPRSSVTRSTAPATSAPATTSAPRTSAAPSTSQPQTSAAGSSSPATSATTAGTSSTAAAAGNAGPTTTG
jgi:serine/threonine protein kinase